jgi:hypothetical protein
MTHNRLGHASNALRENWFLCRVGHTLRLTGSALSPAPCVSSITRVVCVGKRPLTFLALRLDIALRKLIEPKGTNAGLLRCRSARTNLVG